MRKDKPKSSDEIEYVYRIDMKLPFTQEITPPMPAEPSTEEEIRARLRAIDAEIKELERERHRLRRRLERP